MKTYKVYYYATKYVYDELKTVLIIGKDPLDIANKFHYNSKFYFSEIHDIVEVSCSVKDEITNESLANVIKNMIDKNMFDEIEKIAKEQGFTTSGWIRSNLWNLIKEQRK